MTSEQAQHIINILLGIKTTLFYIALWLFMIFVSMPSSSAIRDAIDRLRDRKERQ